MPELDPLSTQLPAMFRQVALYEVHNSRMLPQEHTLLEAYPSLRDDLHAAAKTVAPDAKEVLKKLSSAFFSRPPPGMNSPHLNFWRTPDQVRVKSWQIVTDVEQLYPSIRGTPLAEECKEILQRAIGKVEAHLLNMRATLSASQPGAEKGADEDPETDMSGEPDISAKFHIRRDFFKQWKTAQTVLQFDVIFDSKCTPFVPGCSFASFGFVFQSAIAVGNMMDKTSCEKAWHQLRQVVCSQTNRSSFTSLQQDLDTVRSRKLTFTPSMAPTGTAGPSSAAISITSVQTAQTAQTMGPPPVSTASSAVTGSIAQLSLPPSFPPLRKSSHNDTPTPGRQ